MLRVFSVFDQSVLLSAGQLSSRACANRAGDPAPWGWLSASIADRCVTYRSAGDEALRRTRRMVADHGGSGRVSGRNWLLLAVVSQVITSSASHRARPLVWPPEPRLSS